MKRIFVCNDDVTGVFSAIYDAWKLEREQKEAGIAIRGNLEQQLFCEYVETEESEDKAVAVEQMIKKHMGMEVYWNLYHAVLSEEAGKGNAVLGTMLEARKLSDSRKIMQHLTCPSVLKTFELGRKVGNEAHYFLEFLRFQELEGGVLFAKIKPKSQVLTCIAPHFADRLPLENFMIYDETHENFVVHEAKKNWVLVKGVALDPEKTGRLSSKERQIQHLWKGFCETIAIDERRSYDRQRQHLPLWYRQNMVEFQQ